MLLERLFQILLYHEVIVLLYPTPMEGFHRFFEMEKKVSKFFLPFFKNTYSNLWGGKFGMSHLQAGIRDIDRYDIIAGVRSLALFGRFLL